MSIKLSMAVEEAKDDVAVAFPFFIIFIASKIVNNDGL